MFLSRDSIFLSISIIAVLSIDGTIHVCDVANFFHLRDISSATYYSMYDANTDLNLINVLLFFSVFD